MTPVSVSLWVNSIRKNTLFFIGSMFIRSPGLIFVPNLKNISESVRVEEVSDLTSVSFGRGKYLVHEKL